jgi:hypothetical protein
MLNTAATLNKGLDEESVFSTMRQAALCALLGRSDVRSAPGIGPIAQNDASLT